jgi:hypothetical protein
MHANHPSYWKTLYDRVDSIIAICSNVSRMLRIAMQHTDIKIDLGLIRKTNRTSI